MSSENSSHSDSKNLQVNLLAKSVSDPLKSAPEASPGGGGDGGSGNSSLNAPRPPIEAAHASEKLHSERSQNLLLWLVAIGFFMETLDSTIVNTALPSMAKSLGQSPLYMYSVVIAYSLTIALLIPASGWLADKFGTRRIFMTAILLFTTGSLCCALSQTLAQLVAFRVLQGCGGAMLLPVGRLTVLRAFPKDKFLEAISFVAIPGLIGPLIGPTLGGFLIEIASWHWIFLINIPVGIIGLVSTMLYMPQGVPRPPRKFDVSGFFMLSMSMVMVSLALDGMSELGMRHATILVLILFGLAALCSYWLHAGRAKEPLFSLDLFRVRTFSIGLLGNLFARIGSSSMPFLIPMLLQVSLGYTALQSGLMMIPVAVMGIVSKKIVTPLIMRFGYRQFLVTNTILVGFAMASFAFISRDQNIFARILQLSFFGAVNSLQFSAMNSVTLKDLDDTGASSGNSLFSMVQMLALSFGVASAGAILSAFHEQFGGEHSQGGSLHAFHATFVCMGIITCASAWIFWQLDSDTRSRAKPMAHTQIG